jgi:CO dehydrogenase/acetyl-CoA synthase epsilon subunit
MYFSIAIIIYVVVYKIQNRKKHIYELAKKRAYITKKPLMVIGDPLNGSICNRYFTHNVFGVPYGYGDLCIDLGGCPEYKGSKIKAKLEDVIKNFNTDSYVIYISQTLEYIDSELLKFVIQHLIRVSNKDLFIVNMNYNNDSYNDRFNKFYRNTHFIKTPPEYNKIEYYHLDNKNKKYIIYLDDKY